MDNYKHNTICETANGYGASNDCNAGVINLRLLFTYATQNVYNSTSGFLTFRTVPSPLVCPFVTHWHAPLDTESLTDRLTAVHCRLTSPLDSRCSDQHVYRVRTQRNYDRSREQIGKSKIDEVSSTKAAARMPQQRVVHATCARMEDAVQ